MQKERLRLVTMLVTIADRGYSFENRPSLVRCRFVRYRREIVNIFELTRVRLLRIAYGETGTRSSRREISDASVEPQEASQR